MNYRNTAEVLALAVHCTQSLLEGAGESRDDDEIPLVQPASAGRRGALPVLLEGRDEREEAELIAERIVVAHAAGIVIRIGLGRCSPFGRPAGVQPPVEVVRTRQSCGG